jgi:hypothetical protein
VPGAEEGQKQEQTLARIRIQAINISGESRAGGKIVDSAIEPEICNLQSEICTQGLPSRSFVSLVVEVFRV